MAEVLSAATQWGKTAYNWTNSDQIKQKGIEGMTMVVMLYALKKAVQGHVAESGGSMAVGAVLWMNHEAIIKQNLANTAVVFSTQVSNLEGQLAVVNEQISGLRQLQTQGGKLLGEQEEQLKRLEAQSSSLEKDIESRKLLLKETEEQIQRLKDSVSDTTSEINKKRLAILTFISESNAKMDRLCPELTPTERSELVKSIQLLATVAERVIEPTK